MGASVNTTWNSGGFWEAVEESTALAGELRYIDLAVEYLEDPARSAGHEEVYGPVDTINVQLGWTYPFNFPVRQPRAFATQAWADGLTDTLQGFVDEGAAWAKGEFSGYGDKVKDAALASAITYQSLASILQEDVADAMTTTIPEELSTSLNLGIETFYGTTAEAFRTEYVDRFGAARENQIWVAKSAGVICAASAGIIKQAQHSLMNLMETGKEALKDQLQARPGQYSGVAQTATIIMLAANAAEILGLFKLPEPVEEALGVTSTMLDFAQQGVEHADNREITARTAEDIVTNLQQETTTVMTRYDTHWSDLNSQQVSELKQGIAGMPVDKPFFPPRPDLADGAGPGDFHYENSPLHDGA